MKLHANAALSLEGRQQLCRRVLEEGWTVTEAAGRRGQRPLRSQVGGPVSRGG